VLLEQRHLGIAVRVDVHCSESSLQVVLVSQSQSGMHVDVSRIDIIRVFHHIIASYALKNISILPVSQQGGLMYHHSKVWVRFQKTSVQS